MPLIPTNNTLIAYELGLKYRMKLVPAHSRRDWISATRESFASRCLPMRIGNTAGWFILLDRAVRAMWSGGTGADAVIVEQSGEPPYSAISHFGEGVISFMIPFLFRTAPGVSLLFRGPPNMPKDAISPLDAIVETDWAVAIASVNWKFTRPHSWVEFAIDDPICMIVPQRLDLLEDTNPNVVDIRLVPELMQHTQAWIQSCREFNQKLRQNDHAAVERGWMKYYFNGTAPHLGQQTCPHAAAAEHRTRLNLKDFTLQPPAPPAKDS
jgi:hypothetical protein